MVSNLRPRLGGVASKTIWLCEQLEGWGIEPVLAWYEPWSLSPALSVPVGQWLPELEFTPDHASPAWRALIADCDIHRP